MLVATSFYLFSSGFIDLPVVFKNPIQTNFTNLSKTFSCFIFHTVVMLSLNVIFYLCSAKYCDVDENGVQYMILCRVIMGKTELLFPESGQCLPSSEDVDSGVDDLHHPKYYITWNMNINTHIYPESIVSFKLSSNAKGDIFLLWNAVYLVLICIIPFLLCNIKLKLFSTH